MTRTTLPLTPYQEGLFFVHYLAPEDPFYANGLVLRLRGPLDLDALREALTDLTDRHPALRAGFDLVEGRPVQWIGDEPVSLSTLDLTPLPPAQAYTAAVAHAEAITRRPFDLRTTPNLRATLATVAPGDHMLSLVAHHIVSDGHSMLVITEDLSEAYACRSAGRSPPPARGSPRAYEDECRRWEHPNDTDIVRMERDKGFWREHLGGVEVTVDLLTDRPRPPTSAHLGGTVTVDLPWTCRAAIARLCERHRVSPSVVFLASFRALLVRETRSDDIVIATTVGRRRRGGDLARLVGYFVNPVLVRTPLAREMTFAELLIAERRSTLAALHHSHLPFAEVVRTLGVPRTAGTDAGFQVLFDHQDRRSEDATLSGFRRCGLEASVIELDTSSTAVDLALCVRERGDVTQLVYRYDRELFDRSTIESLSARHRRLLAAVIDAPDRPVQAHSLLSAPERERVLELGRGHATAGDGHTYLHQLFEARADMTPTAVAVDDRGHSVTYGELELLANSGARRLRRAGFTAGELALVWTRGLDVATVVALLAILKAGGCWLAVDPDRPSLAAVAERRRLGLRVGVGPGPAGVPMVMVDVPTALGDLTTHDDTSRPVSCGRTTAAMAYAISTSGSSGQPKVVGISHAGAVNLLRWARRQFSDEEFAGVLATTSPVFDCVLFELFAPLSWGGTAILASSPLEIGRLATDRPVRLLSTVPSTMTALLRTGRLPDSVRTVNLAGESLPPDLTDRIFAASEAGRVVNLYGPSETTTYATAHVHSRRSTDEVSTPERRRFWSRSVIGRPIDNVRVHILDGTQPAPAGTLGELCIGGAGVGIGYLGDGQATSTCFVADPFTHRPGARLYRTGDLGRFLPDGTIEFHGRLDRQLKVRGVRVQPEDIEAVLREHPDVRDAAVVPTGERASSADGMAAFVVPAVDRRVSDVDLTRYLRRRLPHRAVPRSVTSLDELPLTANGKLDRRALLEAERIIRGGGLPGPTGFLEHALIDIFRRVLGCVDVRRSDNFFDIGGDSLRVLVVLATVANELGVELPGNAFMANPTVEGIAAQVADDWRPRRRSPLVRVAADGPGPPLFVVHGGSGDLGFLHTLTGAVDLGRPVYGFQSPGLDGSSAPLDTVEDMAATYVAEIRSQAPAGRYLLAGNCMGGLVAFEMAQQLRREGAEVAFVGLLNSVLPRHGICDAAPIGPDGSVRMSDRQSLVGPRLAALRHEFEALGAADVIDADLASEAAGRPSFFRRLVDVALGNEHAANGYRPSPYPGDVCLFTDVVGADHAAAWRALVGGELHVHHIAPGAIQLAARSDAGRGLRECMDRACRRPAGPPATIASPW